MRLLAGVNRGALIGGLALVALAGCRKAPDGDVPSGVLPGAGDCPAESAVTSAPTIDAAVVLHDGPTAEIGFDGVMVAHDDDELKALIELPEGDPLELDEVDLTTHQVVAVFASEPATCGLSVTDHRVIRIDGRVHVDAVFLDQSTCDRICTDGQAAMLVVAVPIDAEGDEPTGCVRRRGICE